MKSIAVVIPFYNASNSIVNTLNSLKIQTYSEWTAILVDDGSTDDSVEKILQMNDERIILITLQKNSGRGFARQKALNKVRELGFKYMCMLDADDWYYPNKLEVQIKYMENNPNITLMSTAMSFASSKNIIYAVNKPYDNWKEFYCSSFENFIQLPHASSIIRLEDIEGIDYNIHYRYSEDLDFLRRILLKKNYAFCSEILYCYNRDSSFSFSKYYKSLIIDIKSYSSLPISIYKKIEMLLISTVKCVVVFILSIFGLEKLYLKRVGKVPNTEEINNYNRLKKLVLRSE